MPSQVTSPPRRTVENGRDDPGPAIDLCERAEREDDRFAPSPARDMREGVDAARALARTEDLDEVEAQAGVQAGRLEELLAEVAELLDAPSRGAPVRATTERTRE